jgi:hypothetical protein
MAVKPIVIHGAGYGVIKSRKDDSILLRFDKMTEMRFSTELTTEDVYGGDSILPFEAFATEFGATVTLTNARFHPNMFKVLAGTKVEEKQPADIWVFEEGIIFDAPAAGNTANVDLKHKTAYKAGSITVRYKDTGEEFTSTEVAPTKAGEYQIASGVITFHKADAGKGIAVDYQYTDNSTVAISLAADPLLVPVTIIHNGKYSRKDGSFGGIQTTVHLARYMGAFEIVQGRATPAVHAMTFRVLDPERADREFVKFSHFDIAAT